MYLAETKAAAFEIGWCRPNSIQPDEDCGFGVAAQLDLKHPALKRLDGSTELHSDRAAADDPANRRAHLFLQVATRAVLPAGRVEFHAASEDL